MVSYLIIAGFTPDLTSASGKLKHWVGQYNNFQIQEFVISPSATNV